MADDNHKASEATPRTGRARRRPAPTIDLKATEVATEAPAARETPEQASPPPASSAEPAPQTAVPTDPEPSAPPEPPKPEAEAAGSPPPSRPVFWPMVGAAAGGGALVLAAMLLLWGLPTGDDRQAARIAQLEATVQDLTARSPPPSADPKTVASLTQRVAQLEATQGSPPASAANPQLDDRLSAIEKRIASLSETVAALKQRSDAAVTAAETAQRHADQAAAKADTVQAAGAQGAGADRQQVASLTDRITALERTAQTLQKDITQQRAAIAKQRNVRANERAVRLAIIAETLKAAVARGERFRTELEAAKAIAADPSALAPLEAFADTGVPTAATLGQRLRALLPAMRRAVEPKAADDGGFLKRLQVNAERLVRIQPVDEQSGDDAGATLTRIDAKASRGDIAGALMELATLPPTVRAPAEDWIKSARARDAAVDASRRFAAAQIGALAGPSE